MAIAMKRAITPADDAALGRWIRCADDMPTIAQIARRFACSSRAATAMLERQTDAGLIRMVPSRGGRRPVLTERAAR